MVFSTEADLDMCLMLVVGGLKPCFQMRQSRLQHDPRIAASCEDLLKLQSQQGTAPVNELFRA